MNSKYLPCQSYKTSPHALNNSNNICLLIPLANFCSVLFNTISRLECIPVGCLPPAAVDVHLGVLGVCLSACWDTPPWAWAWTPQAWGLDTPLGVAWTPLGPGPGHPWAWAWTPPTRPITLPLGLGLDIPPARPSTSPLDLGLDTPAVNRMTDRCKNITFANFVCGW